MRNSMLGMSLFALFCSAHVEAFELTVSPERAEAIEEIVVTMGESNVIWLKIQEKYLREISRRTKGMGSFNFLGYIFIHPEWKPHMRSIRKSWIKWNGFMESVRKGFLREKEAGVLDEQIDGFAEMLHVNAKFIRMLVKKNDWDGIVSYLIDEA